MITNNTRLHGEVSRLRGSILQLLHCVISEAGNQSFEEQSDALHQGLACGTKQKDGIGT